jgi:hypothetical protein
LAWREGEIPARIHHYFWENRAKSGVFGDDRNHSVGLDRMENVQSGVLQLAIQDHCTGAQFEFAIVADRHVPRVLLFAVKHIVDVNNIDFESRKTVRRL